MARDTLALLLKNYDDLLARIDSHVAGVTTEFTSHIACRKGCDGCCKSLTLFPVEALALSRSFSTLRPADQARVLEAAPEDGRCPLLKGHACMLYEARPIICRTHGLPIYMEKDGHPMVDFCPENFKGVKELPKEALLDLDQLNALLTAVNQHFLSRINSDLPDRIPVSQALLLCREMEGD